MGSTLTVRDIDPEDKSWLKRGARHVGVSMEEFVRRLIREKREKGGLQLKPSEVFARHFGPEHGVELPPSAAARYRPASFRDEGEM